MYTFVLKKRLRFCHRLLAKNGFRDSVEFGFENIHFIDGTLEFRTFSTYIDFNMPNDYFSTVWIKLNGIKYNFDEILITDWVNFMPVFGVIRSIIIKGNTNEVYFV